MKIRTWEINAPGRFHFPTLISANIFRKYHGMNFTREFVVNDFLK